MWRNNNNNNNNHDDDYNHDDGHKKRNKLTLIHFIFDFYITKRKKTFVSYILTLMK